MKKETKQMKKEMNETKERKKETKETKKEMNPNPKKGRPILNTTSEEEHPRLMPKILPDALSGHL